MIEMRTHYCGELNASHIGQEVALCGWVHRHRDHGGVIFIDLRDREGIVQVVCDPQHPESFQVGEKVRSEFVLRIEGQVRRRPEGTENPHIPTGEIEVLAQRAEILNASLPPPFPIEDQDEASEAVRLKYRYLDLRRPKMLERIRMRARIAHVLRQFLEAEGFIEVETPCLTRSTPEGARDYLVPSRLHAGHFYALPQSPQLFKQILMIGGLDRYFQIARCFRDEDLRADRQPEFTQLDIEMSFVREEDVMNIMEAMMRGLFREILGDELPDPFPRLSYREALERFGTDRPDLSNPLELVEVSDLMREVDFKVFAGPARDPEGRVAALRLPQGASLTRKQIDDYTRFVGHYGARGLAYIKVNPEGLQSPILKFLPREVVEEVMGRTGAQSGDILFFGADKARVVNDALGALRQRLADDLHLHRPGWHPVWIVDFPMFEWSEEQHRWVSLHHPFTAPRIDDPALLAEDPASVLSRAYDMVLNGEELGGGSLRIFDPRMQFAVFDLLGISEEEAEAKFGFLIEALRYGCPPHGGIAFGLDRIAMMMAGAPTIREVIAFPKTQTAVCPLTQAPAEVEPEQVRELHLAIVRPPRDIPHSAN